MFPYEFDYELTFLNRGPSSGSGTVDIRLTGGWVRYVIEFVRSSGTFVESTSCTFRSRVEVACPLQPLPSGEASRLWVRVHPNESTLESWAFSTEITISADLQVNQPDPDPTNNFRSESTTVVTKPPLPPLPPLPDPCLLSDDIYELLCDWWW